MVSGHKYFFDISSSVQLTALENNIKYMPVCMEQKL